MVTKVNQEQTTFDQWSILGLADTPASMGNAGDVLVVNLAEDALEFAPVGGGGSSTFLGLTDTPGAYGSYRQILQVNVAENGLEFINAPTIPTVPTELPDFPDFPTYETNAFSILRCNVAETGLEWITPTTLSLSWDQMTEVPDLAAEFGGYFLKVNSGGDAVEFVAQSSAIDPSLINVHSLAGMPAHTPGRFLRASGTSNTLEYAEVTEVTTFAQLGDTPSAGQLAANPGYALVASGGGVALQPFPSGGSSTFVSLSDTPGTLAGQSGKHLKVNDDGDALELVNRPQAPLVLQVGDQTSTITTGTDKLSFRMPEAMTLSKIKAAVKEGPSGGVLTIDVNKNGGTLFTTPITIDSGETTSETAATPSVLTDVTLADDDEITIDIDAVNGSPVGLTLSFIPA